MQIVPAYRDPLGQQENRVSLTRLRGATGTKVTNGLMLNRPLDAFGEDWMERPELQGKDQKAEPSAGAIGLPPL